LSDGTLPNGNIEPPGDVAYAVDYGHIENEVLALFTLSRAV
jgi:hypothetical protein